MDIFWKCTFRQKSGNFSSESNEKGNHFHNWRLPLQVVLFLCSEQNGGNFHFLNFLASSLSSPKNNYGKSNCNYGKCHSPLDGLLMFEKPSSYHRHDYTSVIPTSLFSWLTDGFSTQFITWTLYQQQANVEVMKLKRSASLIFFIWSVGLKWAFISLFQVGNVSLFGLRHHDTKAPKFITFLVCQECLN